MEEFQVRFTARAEADLGRPSRPVAQRVLKKLRWLSENLELITPEPLTADWQGVFKRRISDCRALYTCDRAKKEITVHFVRHRREVYATR